MIDIRSHSVEPPARENYYKSEPREGEWPTKFISCLRIFYIFMSITFEYIQNRELYTENRRFEVYVL